MCFHGGVGQWATVEMSNQEVRSTVSKFASCEFIHTQLYKVPPE